MTIKIDVTYAQLQTINGTLGLNKKLYFVEDSRSNRFVCILTELQNPLVFIFKTTFTAKPLTFETDFPVRQQTQFIDTGVI